MSDTDLCLNCEHPMHGPICSQCGQKLALPFETKRVAKDIWSHFLELDYKFVNAIRDLLTKPGYMIKGYLIGKRIHYTNPFKFLFFTATAYYLIITYFEIQLPFSKENRHTGEIVQALLSYLIFIFLIPTAIAFKWVYKRRVKNIAEAYITVCYLWSGYLLIAIPLAVICLPWIENYLLIRTIFGISFIIIATRQLFSLTWPVAVAKGLAIAFAYFSSSILVMSILIFFAYVIGFEPLMIPPPTGN